MDRKKEKDKNKSFLLRNDDSELYKNEIVIPNIDNYTSEYKNKKEKDIGALITNDFIREIESENLPLIKEKNEREKYRRNQ